MLSIHNTTMAEDIAREIIAQSRGGSKLAFSIKYYSDGALLFTSRDANEKIIYHVHKCRRDATEQYYEFTYSDLESAVHLVRTILPYSGITVEVGVVFYNNGIDCEEVLSLKSVSSYSLTDYLKDKVMLLNAVNVTAHNQS